MREFHWVVNAKEAENRSTIRMEGFRCIDFCAENDELEEVELSNTPLPWSEPSSWESGEVPVEGEEVEIPSGVWIVLDIEETPLLWSVTINGRLSF